MGNQCCSNSADETNANEVMNSTGLLKQQLEAAQLELLNDPTKGGLFTDSQMVEYKQDYEVGEGASYTGQMLKSIDTTNNGGLIYIKHGKGVQIWPDGATYDGDWVNGMA